jgi:hypothetical protein
MTPAETPRLAALVTDSAEQISRAIAKGTQ